MNVANPIRLTAALLKLKADRLVVYAICLVGASLAVAALLAVGRESRFGWPVLALAALSAIAEQSRVRLSATVELSISLLPMLFAAVVFGPLGAMCVGAASLVGDLPIRRTKRAYDQPWLRWLIYTTSESLTGAIVGLATAAALGLTQNRLGSIVAATAIGAVVAQVMDGCFSAVTLLLRRRGSIRDVIRTLAPVAAASVPLYAPIVAVLAYTYEEVSPWTLPLFLAPALAAHRLYALYQSQMLLTQELVTANKRLERASLSFASALVATLDARDQYTAGHSAAVAVYSRDIAQRLGLSEEEQQLAHLCGLVHDIGKIGLSPGLLEKPGALNLEERRQMETHPVIGERILSKVEDYSEIAKIVRHHHEQVDGLGYPDGLRDKRIPLIARIIAVADAYNAMTSDRPYRDAMPSRVARLRLAQAVESQFDTSIVAAFEAILASSDELYRSGHRSTFADEVEELMADSLIAVG